MNTEVNQDEGRQGVTGHNVRTVLVLSLVGAVVAIAIVFFWLVV